MKTGVLPPDGVLPSPLEINAANNAELRANTQNILSVIPTRGDAVGLAFRPELLESVAFLPDGRQLASGSDDQINLEAQVREPDESGGEQLR